MNKNKKVEVQVTNSQLGERKKIRSDRTANISSSVLSWIFSLIFLCLIGFIIYASVPGFKTYGFNNIILTGKFNLNNNQASVWLPLCITILSAGIAILIAGPLGIKSAVFIKYRCPKKAQKPLRIIIEVLADIPSVIFGLFAANALGTLVGAVFGKGASYSVITAALMLTFMILPTIVSLSLNALEGVDVSLLACALAMGNTKTRAIYKICKKECRNGIVVGVIVAIARAIGETMAVSMILQSQLYNSTFDHGFWAVCTSGLRSLGALISANMFAEGGGAGLQGLLFAFGIVMFIFVIILNAIAMSLTKKKMRDKYSKAARAMDKIGAFFVFIPRQIGIAWEKITYPHKIKNGDYQAFIVTRAEKNGAIKFYDGWKLFWEWFAIILTSAFIVWIVGDVVVRGIGALASSDQTLFTWGKNTTSMALINTLIIIVIAIGIGFPLALLIALYINEFAKEGKLKKVMIFFIDSLGATPSILFGMFGLIFFIQTLGITSQGTAGKSMIAGVLTILIVILPTFIRTIQQSLASVPMELRQNSYALGAGKWETIRKVVLPMAFQGIMTSVVLSIGRILAETAPLYLTSGLSSSSSVSLLTEGQTLTTRIYAQIYESGVSKGTNIMYECAIVTMILVLIIILIVHVAIPAYFNHKRKKDEMRYAALKLYKERQDEEKNESKNNKKLNLNKIQSKENNPSIINLNWNYNYNFFRMNQSRKRIF